jgi:transcriptional regulator with XRE-family HTH domain
MDPLARMKTRPKTFALKLRDKLLTRMARNGLNGQKLARTSQVSDSEISRILAGLSTPGLENAFKLAKAVGVSLDFLADDSLESDPLQAADPLTSEEREVLELAHGLGCARASRILENIRIIGYETAMRRLLEARPAVEPEEGARPTSPVAPVPARQALAQELRG